MGYMTINGKKVEFTDEKNVLSVIRKAGFTVPTLCYNPELTIFGACRLCTVEDDRGKMFASCSEEPRDGMVIYTNTKKLQKYRRMIVELLLAAHDRDCTTCAKSGNCELQKLAKQMGVTNVRFQNTKERLPIDGSSPSIVRDPNKCVLCGQCVRVCEEVQSVGALGFAFRGTEATTTTAFNQPLVETDCVNCGQCRAVCPTGAITIHDNKDDIWAVLNDPTKRVVAQIAPAVRVAAGEAFGMGRGENGMGKVVSALHAMGFDEVYDTVYTADMTIIEETNEFLGRVTNGGVLPLMTSCCPAWVKFVHDQYPELVPNISTCRSPQEMLSAVIKEYAREKVEDERKTVVISIMPCTAKKMEAKRPDSVNKDEQNTDFVLTTTELIGMIQTAGLDLENLEAEECDQPFGIGSGGGVIFGVTGGVTEAVLRRLTDGKTPETVKFMEECGVRGAEGIKEFVVDYKGTTVKGCVISGLANARKVLDRVKAGEADYAFIEVMACPGGCVMGGGQPINLKDGTRCTRTAGLYNAGEEKEIWKSDENPFLKELYDTFLGGKEHELLHNHIKW